MKLIALIYRLISDDMLPLFSVAKEVEQGPEEYLAVNTQENTSVMKLISYVSLQDRKQKRADEANRPPAESAADAARHMLASKVLMRLIT